jgi:mannose-6-phosphate isomerase-like protein (cupin superfamily)
MSDFETVLLGSRRDAVAPDGSDVRLLPGLAGGGMAHFELAAGRTSSAVAHRTVEEIWFFVGGLGEMWRRQGDREETVTVAPGVAVSIPVGTRFQFRALGTAPLAAVAVTMPPWPGPDEAYPVDGPWEASPPPA